MDFDLTVEQKLLQESARDFLSRECPRERVRNSKKPARRILRSCGERGRARMDGTDHPGRIRRQRRLIPGSDRPVRGDGVQYLSGPLFSTVVLGALPVLAAGSEAQKKAILPAIARVNI